MSGEIQFEFCLLKKKCVYQNLISSYDRKNTYKNKFWNGNIRVYCNRDELFEIIKIDIVLLRNGFIVHREIDF